MAGPAITAPALRALLPGLVDYAGTFPPAGLPLETALANFRRYRDGAERWLLGRFVIRAADLAAVPADCDFRFAVLADSVQPRAEVIESKRIVTASIPVYCEVDATLLPEVKRCGAFAKLRTGGITPDAIPNIADVANYLRTCADLRLPFKATAGLHHPIRSVHPLTYSPGAACATMHGFVNVFVAAVFVWTGLRDIEPVLAETDPAAFRFDDDVHWRDLRICARQAAEARQHFAHSFGSCSFEEPVNDLRQLGWL